MTGKRLDFEPNVFSDDEYEWNGDLHYLVENYNVKLPKEFMNKIFKNKGE